MTGYHSNWYNTCGPDETSIGTLKDLGSTIYTNGSLIHSLWGIQIRCTPDWVRNLQRQMEGATPEGEYNLWFHI
eukprot:CAMPEP_0168613274 /NCGR_PEP_ID=MMETSP0449_2-20121227/3364_1 /TAXON_ID=1082188 /ORGANISM="Strombidium rassoulzadegani, Strain ras09" /LENGTH=73 /DNA_ID=CAMNT_0008653897 /DNA_START=776 /DNA_END=997 /DNA_ORIENTATION=+